MKIKDLLERIAPTIYKKDLIDIVYNTAKELDEINLKVYKEANMNFSNWQFRSKEARVKLILFNQMVKSRKGNMVTTVYDRLLKIDKIIKNITPFIEKHFQEANASSALSFRKAQYLQFLDHVKFYLTYSREFLNYLISYETEDKGKNLTPKREKTIEEDFPAFCRLTEMLSRPESEILSSLDQITDRIIVPDSIDLVESSYSQKQLDPLGSNFISTTYNPISAIAVRMALSHHRAYEKALEERKLLQLRLLGLKRQNDPNLAKNIETIEDRINELEYKIAKEAQAYA